MQFQETLNAEEAEKAEVSTDDDLPSTVPSKVTEEPSDPLLWERSAPMENDEPDMRPRKKSGTRGNTSATDDQALNLETILALGDQQNPTTSQRNEDEITYFSQFIASKMRKYSETTKNAVQQAICDVIFKADQTCSEQTPYQKSATSDRSNEPRFAEQPSSSKGYIYIKQETLQNFSDSE